MTHTTLPSVLIYVPTLLPVPSPVLPVLEQLRRLQTEILSCLPAPAVSKFSPLAVFYGGLLRPRNSESEEKKTPLTPRQ